MLELEKDFRTGPLILLMRNGNLSCKEQDSSLCSLSCMITQPFCFQLQPCWDKNEPMHGRWKVEWNFSTVSTCVLK